MTPQEILPLLEVAPYYIGAFMVVVGGITLWIANR